MIHGGIETGQGINTKVAQVVAKTLGFGHDYAQISVKPVDVNVHPNNAGTGGSTTSEMTCVVSDFSLSLFADNSSTCTQIAR